MGNTHGKNQNKGKVLTVFGNKIEATVPAFGVTTDESLGSDNRKNPMLITPVIRCVLKFLNMEDMKNCRLVSTEWGSTGKLMLAKRAVICFDIRKPGQNFRSMDFQSLFIDSATLFSAFEISGPFGKSGEHDRLTIEELTKFFNEQQKYIKELTLKLEYSKGQIEKSININSWISQTPMVKPDAKHMTKLFIQGNGEMFDIPLHFIAHIKDLSLKRCKIHLEAGIKICPIKLELGNATFYENGIELDQVRINDIVDLSKATDVLLHCWDLETTKYVLDLSGNATLDNLVLTSVDTMNGETTNWVIKNRLAILFIPYSLLRQIKVKELFLLKAGNIDLCTLPDSIQKLCLQQVGHDLTISCSQPIAMKNLQYLQIVCGKQMEDYSFLSHFVNCPQLTHLKFQGCAIKKPKSLCMPKHLKTLTIEDSLVYYEEVSYLNLEKLIVSHWGTAFRARDFRTTVQVENFVLFCVRIPVGKELVDLLKYRNRFYYSKRLYIGKLDWKEKQLEDTILKEYVDVKSSFYVFKNGEKGRAISKEDFFQVFPKHVDLFVDQTTILTISYNLE